MNAEIISLYINQESFNVDQVFHQFQLLRALSIYQEQKLKIIKSLKDRLKGIEKEFLNKVTRVRQLSFTSFQNSDSQIAIIHDPPYFQEKQIWDNGYSNESIYQINLKGYSVQLNTSQYAKIVINDKSQDQKQNEVKSDVEISDYISPLPQNELFSDKASQISLGKFLEQTKVTKIINQQNIQAQFEFNTAMKKKLSKTQHKKVKVQEHYLSEQIKIVQTGFKD